MQNQLFYLSSYLWLYSPCELWTLFQFLNLYTVGRTPWTEDQPRRKAATYTQDNTNRELTHTDIHASSWIRTHDVSVRAGEDGSCLRPPSHCDRENQLLGNDRYKQRSTPFFTLVIEDRKIGKNMKGRDCDVFRVL
jgi:hypothetical protein